MTAVPAAAAVRSLWIEQGVVRTLDQSRLPFETVVIDLETAASCERAIRDMQVRGAPLIGAVAAYGLALSLRHSPTDEALEAATARLLATRPTAVNLRWALERMNDVVRPQPPAARAAAAWDEAGRLCDDDVACNRAIGEALCRLLPRPAGRALQILTHCNAGRLATVAWGTALAPIYLLHAQGVPLHVWVDETRPRNQGASLTAWELADRGIAHTVIADNAGGLLMMRGQVDAVIVGCDRVARNGDVVNKIGTYLKALAARAHGVPFLVACPVSTIDMRCPDGDSVPIEERAPDEITLMRGQLDDGSVAQLRIMARDTVAANPAFDVTPANLVTAIVTEHGACEASTAGLTEVTGQ